MKHRLKLKVGDVILMAIVLATAILMFILPFFAETALNAEIVISENEETRLIDLRKNASYEINSLGVMLTVCVADGKIFVTESNCRDSICKNTPPISKVGQSIVCVPAGVVVRVIGEEADVDGISG